MPPGLIRICREPADERPQGQHDGDALLIETSTRLKSVLHEYDFIARFGRDEFIVTLEYGNEAFATSRIAKKMIHLLESEPGSDAKTIDLFLFYRQYGTISDYNHKGY